MDRDQLTAAFTASLTRWKRAYDDLGRPPEQLLTELERIADEHKFGMRGEHGPELVSLSPDGPVYGNRPPAPDPEPPARDATPAPRRRPASPAGGRKGRPAQGRRGRPGAAKGGES